MGKRHITAKCLYQICRTLQVQSTPSVVPNFLFPVNVKYQQEKELLTSNNLNWHHDERIDFQAYIYTELVMQQKRVV